MREGGCALHGSQGSQGGRPATLQPLSCPHCDQQPNQTPGRGHSQHAGELPPLVATTLPRKVPVEGPSSLPGGVWAAWASRVSCRTPGQAGLGWGPRGQLSSPSLGSWCMCDPDITATVLQVSGVPLCPPELQLLSEGGTWGGLKWRLPWVGGQCGWEDVAVLWEGPAQAEFHCRLLGPGSGAEQRWA